jgi:hypothetical protein
MCWHSTRQIHRSSTPLILISYSSSANYLVPRSALSILFECGLRSLESFSLGQQRLYIIRVRASVPRIIFFGPAAPLYYLSAGFSPSNRSLRASSASILFECGLRSLESFSLGQQCLYIIRVRASVPRIALFEPAVPPYYSSAGSGPSNCFLRIFDAFTIFECGLRSLKSFSSGQQHLYILRVRSSVP